MSDLDHRVRLAAFEFLDRLQREDELLSRDALATGFVLDGERVPLMGPQGIFKPCICKLPLSITTVPEPDDGRRPYDDAMGADGLLRYRYRGMDVNHPDNARLREAGRRRTPLVYLHGIVPDAFELRALIEALPAADLKARADTDKGELKGLWKLRGMATHGDRYDDNKPITSADAGRLVRGVLRVSDTWESAQSPPAIE